jgi:hypothetical protein
MVLGGLRVSAGRFPVTQEFLATASGAVEGRFGLDVVGILQVERSRIIVIIRDARLDTSCECCEIITNTYAPVGWRTRPAMGGLAIGMLGNHFSVRPRDVDA